MTDESLDGGFALALTEDGVRNVIESILLGAEEPLEVETISRVAGEILEASLEMAIAHSIAKMAMAGLFLINKQGGLTMRAEKSVALSPVVGCSPTQLTVSEEKTLTNDVTASENPQSDDDDEEDSSNEVEDLPHSPPSPRTWGRPHYRATEDDIAKAKGMFEKGGTYPDIGKAVGVSRATVLNWARRYGWERDSDRDRNQREEKRETRGEDFILDVGISVCGSGVEVAAQEHGLPVATVERLAGERGWVVLPHCVPDSPATPASTEAPKATPRRRCPHCESLTETDPCHVCRRAWRPAGLVSERSA